MVDSSRGYCQYQHFYNTISLSRHEQVCLMRLHFERYFSHHRANKIILSHIFKGNMWTWTETIKLTNKSMLCIVTNSDK